ncbi:MAG: MBL fold metallo-hydrolase [Selenomonadaceae bacterium]|nr:MBL fold metallo-hydrolase [Selenomonadaceae bacterium]
MVLTVCVEKYIPTNAYFMVDGATRHAFLIDPGAEGAKLLAVAKKEGLTIEKILLTHGHFDHIGAVEEIRRELDIPVCMEEHGLDYVTHPGHNGSAFTPEPIKLTEVQFLPDGSDIALESGACPLRLIATPGHTLDSCIYYSAQEKLAFAGDTIFAASYGRTDLYGGSEEAIIKNIKEKILTLPPETALLCGHEAATTVEAERNREWYRWG